LACGCCIAQRREFCSHLQAAALLARARAVQSQLAKATEELATIAGELGGNVAFGASAAGLMLVPDALTQFRSEYPRAYVRIVEGAPRALLPLLRDESLDFFIGPKPVGGGDTQIKTRPLFRLPLAIAARRKHPLRGATRLSELADAPWLLFSSSGWRDSLLAQAFTAAELAQPAQVIQCESYATALALLSQSDILGLIPKAQLSASNLGGVLEGIVVAERLPDLVFAMYSRADGALTPPATMLMRTITAGARSLAATSVGM
jgi:LysR family transcriptional regulator of abg operon